MDNELLDLFDDNPQVSTEVSLEADETAVEVSLEADATPQEDPVVSNETAPSFSEEDVQRIVEQALAAQAGVQVESGPGGKFDFDWPKLAYGQHYGVMRMGARSQSEVSHFPTRKATEEYITREQDGGTEEHPRPRWPVKLFLQTPTQPNKFIRNIGL